MNWLNNIYDTIIDYSIFIIMLIDKIMYWIACLVGIFNVWLYIATKEDKPKNTIIFLFLLYLFIHMVVQIIIR